MPKVKAWLKAWCYKNLPSAAALFIAVYGLVLPAHAEICNFVFHKILSEQVSELSIAQAFQSIQKQDLFSKFAYPEDRVLLRLAKGPDDRALSLLSDHALNTIRTLSESAPSLIALMSGIAEKSLSESSVREMLARPIVHPLENILKKRSFEQWEEIIRYYQGLSPEEQAYPHVKLQTALAYNRRHMPGDRTQAETMIRSVIDHPMGLHDNEILAEAYGILARIYKDRWAETHEDHYLQHAIDTYLEGFAADPLNYYPGSAALELLSSIPGEDAAHEADELAKAVRIALDQSIAKNPNVWAYSTQLSLALRDPDWVTADAAFSEMLNRADLMAIRTKKQGLERVLALWENESLHSPMDRKHLSDLIHQLDQRLVQMQNEEVNRPSMVLSSHHLFPDTEGAIHLKPLVVREEMIRSEVLQDLTPDVMQTIQQESVHKFLQTYQAETLKNPGYVLGVTGPYAQAIGVIARRSGHTPWWDAYAQLGIRKDVAHTQQFLEAIAAQDKPIILLIPPEFRTLHQHSTTWAEYEWLIQHRHQVKGSIEFVYGAHELMGMKFYKDLADTQRHAAGYSELHKIELLYKLQEYLTELGSAIVH